MIWRWQSDVLRLKPKLIERDATPEQVWCVALGLANEGRAARWLDLAHVSEIVQGKEELVYL